VEGLEKTTVLDVVDVLDMVDDVWASREAAKRNGTNKNRLVVISQTHSLSIAIRWSKLAATNKRLRCRIANREYVMSGGIISQEKTNTT
jgi:hypothetical protein